MTSQPLYRGTGQARDDVEFPAAPPWRQFPRQSAAPHFEASAGLIDAVNAALCLRRPLLITGSPGSGKSTVIEQVAEELGLGPVLRWHITSRSNVEEALYRYDALGRIHAQRVNAGPGGDNIAPFLELGPLGTALLPAEKPRALLIDEIDKCDLDLPGDLLEVLERGEFEIRELVREDQDRVEIRAWQSSDSHLVVDGRVQCTEFPFIVLTSNADQELPAPFLRRCIRYDMPMPDERVLRQVIQNWLDVDVTAAGNESLADLVKVFAERLAKKESLAIDQLLNTVHYVFGPDTRHDGARREELIAMLTRDLSRG